MSQNLKSKDAIVFTQFAIYQSQSFKITQYFLDMSDNLALVLGVALSVVVRVRAPLIGCHATQSVYRH